MIEGDADRIASTGAMVMLPVEEGSSLWRLLIVAAFFLGPAILKSIKESKSKKKALAERAGGGTGPGMDPAASATEPLTQDDASGRDQWERLLRADSRAESPLAPPPIPPIPQVPRRRVLTETRALTEEPALTESQTLTDSPALTDVRVPTIATPGQSYDDQPGQKSPLRGDFAEFAPQEGLASDREGGPAKRVGATPSFVGAAEFQGLSTAGAASEVTRKEIGGAGSTEAASRLRPLARRRFARSDLRSSVLAAEILGPPLALRALETGPTRPLGWS